MPRVQLALNVDDLDAAITFYSKLFGTEPAKRKPGYANFAITEPSLKLVLLENPGQGGTLNHLGVEVDSSDTVHSEIARLTEAGLLGNVSYRVGQKKLVWDSAAARATNCPEADQFLEVAYRSGRGQPAKPLITRDQLRQMLVRVNFSTGS